MNKLHCLQSMGGEMDISFIIHRMFEHSSNEALLGEPLPSLAPYSTLHSSFWANLPMLPAARVPVL